MKLFSILKGTIPISLARLTNQIIDVCAFLTNFQPVLIPLPDQEMCSDVEAYFDKLSDSSPDSSESESDPCN